MWLWLDLFDVGDVEVVVGWYLLVGVVECLFNLCLIFFIVVGVDYVFGVVWVYLYVLVCCIVDFVLVVGMVEYVLWVVLYYYCVLD